MSEHSPHKVIRASAGSGKTFALSSRYLKLLRLGAEPDEILATTFTRKAAGEILGRVLLRLAEAASTAEGAAGSHTRAAGPTGCHAETARCTAATPARTAVGITSHRHGRAGAASGLTAPPMAHPHVALSGPIGSGGTILSDLEQVRTAGRGPPRPGS